MPIATSPDATYREEAPHELGTDTQGDGANDQGEVEGASSRSIEHPIEAELYGQRAIPRQPTRDRRNVVTDMWMPTVKMKKVKRRSTLSFTAAMRISDRPTYAERKTRKRKAPDAAHNESASSAETFWELGRRLHLPAKGVRKRMALVS